MTDSRSASLQETKDAILEAIATAAGTANVVDIVNGISRQHAPSTVREAYWGLITDGAISTDASGNIKRLEHLTPA